MKIGLYQFKYPARKMIEGILPYAAKINPNTVSLAMLPTGLAIAVFFFFGWKLTALLLCFLRMFLGTLDGLVAVRFKKESAAGEMLNRLAPEICDVMYLLAIVIARPDLILPGVLMLGVSWIISFCGILGLFAGQEVQSVGPVGQTDRLAAFMIFLFLQFCMPSIDFLPIFIWWCILGGLSTIILRLWRIFNGIA